MTPNLLLGVACGMFFTNWLLVPLLGFRSFRDGFWVGLIAAGMILLVWVFVLCNPRFK